MKLNIRRRRKKRLPARLKQPLLASSAQNETWSMDFISDKLVDGRTFRVLNIMDDFNRELLCIDVDTSLPAQRVIRSLNQAAFINGYPKNIRIDNGPEFISNSLKFWAEKHGVTLQFIQPGKPMQNAYIERLNGSLRSEILDAYLFTSLRQVRELLHEWQYDYNYCRPHKSLDYKSPVNYKNELQNQ